MHLGVLYMSMLPPGPTLYVAVVGNASSDAAYYGPHELYEKYVINDSGDGPNRAIGYITELVCCLQGFPCIFTCM